MINVPSAILEALKSDNLKYANLVTLNFGDAFGTGVDYIVTITDAGYDLELDGNTYLHDNSLTGLEGLSRKAEVGSDVIDISFAIVDDVICDVIETKRYSYKPTSIDRVLLDPVDGSIIEGFKIPIRTAWGVNHYFEGDLDNRYVVYSLDTSLGALNNDNGWYALNSSHQKRYANDLIMKWSSTTFTEEQERVYSTNFTGTIDQNIKPNAVPVIYGYKNATLVPICQLHHRKSHTSYRHYFTTWIYVISAGDLESVDLSNVRRDGEDVDMTLVTDNSQDIGGWSFRVMSPSENNTQITVNPKLTFWREQMDASEISRLQGMFGQGLTLMFVKNRNRDDWIYTPPEITVPVEGVRVYDPRTSTSVFSRNPGLQYADYLRNTDYGAGNRGIEITDANIIELANHYDNLPGSTGNPGINDIKFDVQIDTAQPLVDNMNIWTEGARMYATDYYGEYSVKIETIASPVMALDEFDCEREEFNYESGEVTERITRLTYKVKQLVDDESEEAEPGDLVEVEVEATFPELGSDIYNEWLAEDGNVENFDSSDLENVTELEQAFYWAMVDARTSRRPDRLTLSLGPIGWVLESFDIITFSSQRPYQDDEHWRIIELEEDEDTGEVELTLKPYSQSFYLPDPDVIPDPPSYATIRRDVLGTVADVSIDNFQDNYYLTFTPLNDTSVTHYAIEIEDANNPGVLLYDEPQLAFPPLMLPNIEVGSYTGRITAIGNFIEGPVGLFTFDIGELVTPITVPSIIGVPGRIVVEPPTPQFDNRTYEWRYYTSESASLVYWGDGRILNLTPIVENVTYYIEYRLKSTVSNVVAGLWETVQVNGVEQTLYTWLAYADDAVGTNISESPVGKAYYGVATGRTVETFDVNTVDVTLFRWIAQASGGGGEPAINATLSNESHGISSDSNGSVISYVGASTTLKVFVGIVEDTNAWNISATTGGGISGNLSGNTYTVTSLGVDATYVDLTATRTGYADITKRFTVFKIRYGEDGATGPQGDQGIQGPRGDDGEATYFHIAYADNADGSIGFNQSSGDYVGTYVDDDPNDSTDPNDYNWQKWVGAQGPEGDQGIPGVGQDGETTYLHIAYADNISGSSGFNTGNWTGEDYIGTYTDFTLNDSTDPDDYDWKKFVGEEGPEGPVGPVGPSGQDSPDAYGDRDSDSGSTSSSAWQTLASVTVPSGLGTFTLEAVGNFSGSATRTFNIEPIDVNCRIEVKIINAGTGGTISGSDDYAPSASSYDDSPSLNYSYTTGGAGAGTYTVQARMLTQTTADSQSFSWSVAIQSERN